MWIMNQDKTCLINTDRVTEIYLGEDYADRPYIGVRIAGWPNDSIGEYNTMDEAENELYRIFSNLEGDYHIMAPRSDADEG